MKNNVLPQKNTTNLSIYTSLSKLFSNIKFKIANFIEFQIIKLLGPYLHYAIDRILVKKSKTNLFQNTKLIQVTMIL